MSDRKYRHIQTGMEYKDVYFNNTPIATVTTYNGSVYNVERKHIEEVPAPKQVDLFTKESEADKKFREFDEKNPHVYRQLVKMTRDLKAQGHKKIGMQMLFEVIRWRSMMKTSDTDFKMNNNYAGRYARKVMSENSDLDNMFELRTLKT